MSTRKIRHDTIQWGQGSPVRGGLVGPSRHAPPELTEPQTARPFLPSARQGQYGPEDGPKMSASNSQCQPSSLPGLLVLWVLLVVLPREPLTRLRYRFAERRVVCGVVSPRFMECAAVTSVVFNAGHATTLSLTSLQLAPYAVQNPMQCVLVISCHDSQLKFCFWATAHGTYGERTSC